MKTKSGNRITAMLIFSLLFTFLLLPESYADDKLYLTEDDVEVIPLEDSEDWMTIGLNDGLVMAMGLKNVGSNRYYDYKGKIVLSEEKLKNNMAFSLFSEGYAVSSKGIIDKKGNFIYQSPVHLLRQQDIFFRGIIPVNTAESKGDWGAETGLLNARGAWAVEPGRFRFDYAGLFEGLIAASDTNAEHPKMGYINREGKVIIAFEYENCRPFSEGLAIVQAFDRTKEAFGLVTSYPMVIDKRGKKVFTPEKYYGLDEYSHGLAAVEVPLAGLNEHRWGYMDMAGEMVIQPIYDFAYPFSEGLAAVGVYKSDKARKDKDTTQTDWSFIDEKGHVVLNLDDDYFIEPRHRPSIESLHLKSQKYLASGVFKNGLCLVQKKKEYPENTQELSQSHSVLIDAKGRELSLDKLKFFQDKEEARIYSLIVENHAQVRYFEKGNLRGKGNLILRFKNPDMFKPYKVYNINDYHYDVKTGYAKSVNREGVSEDEAANNKPGGTTVTAGFNKLNLSLDGKPVTGAESYLINGNSYFKLRDIAAIYAPTARKFSVDWSSEKKLITVKTGAAYTVQGSELKGGDGSAKTAHPSKAILEVNGRQVHIKAYDIGGNNYYKLRELAEALGISLNWNESTRTIELMTK